MLTSIPFTTTIDKNLTLNPIDSKAIKIIQESLVQLSIPMDFYSFDGDGLVGQLTKY